MYRKRYPTEKRHWSTANTCLCVRSNHVQTRNNINSIFVYFVVHYAPKILCHYNEHYNTCCVYWLFIQSLKITFWMTMTYILINYLLYLPPITKSYCIIILIHNPWWFNWLNHQINSKLRYKLFIFISYT